MKFEMQLARDLVAVLPDSVKRERGVALLPDWHRSLFGEILGVGPDVTGLLPGERVAFGAAKGMESVYDGAAIRIMRFVDVDFVLEPEDAAA